jgi:hypothetical protein
MMETSSPVPTQLALRCFVSAAQDIERPALSRMLDELGVSAVFVEDFPPSVASATEAVQHALSTADFVVGVLSDSADNSNVMFELGVSVALEKPIIAVIPRRMPTPTPLDRQFVVRGDGVGDTALRFSIEQLVHRLVAGDVRTSGTPVAPISRRTLGTTAEELLLRLDAFGADAREQEIVQVLHDAFQALSLTVVEGGRDARFDLGIWDPELTALVGNPFVIEVKRELNDRRTIDHSLTQVESYLEATGGRWALLVYGSGDPAVVDQAAWARPVLASSVRDMVRSLRDVPFAEFLRRLRAQRVHGGPPGA